MAPIARTLAVTAALAVVGIAGAHAAERSPVTGCGSLTVSDEAPQATLPETLVLRKGTGRLRLYLRDVSQKTRMDVRLTMNGKVIDTLGPSGYSCATRGSRPPAQSFLITKDGRLRIYGSARPEVTVKLVLTNGSGRRTSLRGTLKVRR